MSTRLALILAAIAISTIGLSTPSRAGSTTAAAHKVPMHPSTLTLGRSRPAPRRTHPRHNHVHATFNRPPHIHGTMAGPRM